MQALCNKINAILNKLSSIHPMYDTREDVDQIYYNICDILRTSNFDTIVFVYEEIDSLLRKLIEKGVDVTRVKYLLERHNFLKEKHYRFSWAPDPIDYDVYIKEFFGDVLDKYENRERDKYQHMYFQALTIVNSLPNNRINSNEVMDEWLKLINSKITREAQKLTYYVMVYYLQHDKGRFLNSEIFIEKLKTLISSWLSIYSDGIIYDLENYHQSGIIELKFPQYGNRKIKQIDFLLFLYVFYRYAKLNLNTYNFQSFVRNVQDLRRSGFTEPQIKILDKFITTYENPLKKTRWDTYISDSRAFDTKTNNIEDKKKLETQINKVKSIYQSLELNNKEFEEHINDINSANYFITK